MNAEPQDVLSREAVRLGCRATDKDDAIRQCGAVLVEIGAVAAPYTDAMIEREKSISTYLGEYVAIPHGTDAGRVHVNRPALSVLGFPDGVDWNGNTVHVAVAIASSGNQHLSVLQSLAGVLSDADKARRLREATDVDEVLKLLAPVSEDDED